jgi:hypothetical protein
MAALTQNKTNDRSILHESAVRWEARGGLELRT